MMLCNEKMLNFLIVGKSASCTTMALYLKDELGGKSNQIFSFDRDQLPIEEIFNSSYPNESQADSAEATKSIDFKRAQVFNTDPGRQLAGALVQEYERRNEPHSLLFHDNLHANQMLWNMVQDYLIERQITWIVFLNQPIELTEIILYQVAEALEKKTLILSHSIVHNRFFSYQSLTDFGNYELADQSTDSNVLNNRDVIELENNILNDADCQGLTLPAVVRTILFLLRKRSIRLFDPLYVVRQARHLHDAPTNMKDWHDPFAKFFFVKRSAYFEFFTSGADVESILSRRFVYFPLQPLKELYSEILFNRYSDQLLAIERLSVIIPDDCTIVVKDDEIGSSEYLSPMFFHRLRRITNVVRVSSCVNSRPLLEYCELLATVNSANGWTALNLGKKSLVFGKPWYWKLPGVHRYHDGISYQNILKSDFTHADLIRQVNILFTRSHCGDLNSIGKESAAELETTDLENHATGIAKVISRLIFNHTETSFRSTEQSESLASHSERSD